MATGEGKTKKTACVTGGNGFVASSLIKLLLENGYAVHATVRDPEATAKVAHLKALQSLGDLKLFRADLLAEGSFDEAVAGCDYVFLVASPVDLDAEDPENKLIKPAVEGTLNALRSCSKAATVKRVILTSSGAAVSGNRLEGTGLVMDEKDWTDVDYLYEEKPPTWGYLFAKTMTEKAAWKYAEEHKLDLVAVNPTLIVGPSLTPDPPFSVRLALALITGGELEQLGLKIMQKVSGSISFVHIEDVCRAQIYLAETESASGRYILSKINSGLWDLAGFLSKRYPHYKVTADLGDVPAENKLSFSSEKLVKEGFQFKHEKLEEMYDEIMELGKATGLLPSEHGNTK
uniref:Anthocyanidin reductase n=1 Tax=Anthurium amnicola TaxID=1678845 RepID=A0A1D1YFB8_9ARAE